MKANNNKEHNWIFDWLNEPAATMQIPLWKNMHELSEHVAVIDAEDYDKVVAAAWNKRSNEPGKWYAHRVTPDSGLYAMSGCRRTSIHRIVMGEPEGMDVHHENHDPLDNRKVNLVICTRQQNSSHKVLRRDSSSGYKGVYRIKKGPRSKYITTAGEVRYYQNADPKKRFKAYISDPKTAYPNKRHINLGTFATAEEAAARRDLEAVRLHGRFAYLNFPERLIEYQSEV